MERKNELNNAELKEVSGGLRQVGFKIFCSHCQTVLYRNVMYEQVEDTLKMCRATHKCTSPYFKPGDITACPN